MGYCCQSANIDSGNVGINRSRADTDISQVNRLKSMIDLQNLIKNKDMSYFIDVKWSEKELNRVGHLNKADAKDFIEDVLKYAA